jgi:L-asparaginase / beta-aspartyl-peptidase
MQQVVQTKLVSIKGEGGMIGVDNKGNYCLEFNSAGMYRAVRSSDGSYEVAIYR